MKYSTRGLVFTALLAAVICVLAPISVPIGPVPISLATFAVYIAASTISWRHGAAAVLLYILIGAVGAPVFSSFTGGLPKLFGVTGGYILGYIPMALITGLIVDRSSRRLWVYPVAMTVGTLVCYLCGTAWFMWQTGNTLIQSLTLCVLPFLIGDAGKIVAATAVSPVLRARLAGLLRGSSKSV